MPHPDDGYDDYQPDDDRPRPPRRKSRTPTVLIVLLVVGLVLLVCGAPLCIGLLLPAVQKVRESANRLKSENNLKQIGLAIHNYADVNDELPNNTYGPDGKPLLSWRVHLLPYLEQDNLYKEFKLDEPWDSPNNIRLLGQMPKVYALPRAPDASKTYCRGFSSPGAVFAPRPPRPKGPEGAGFTFKSFKDPAAEVLLVVEAADPVEWTKPDDLDAAPGKPFPALGGPKGSGGRCSAVFADAQTRRLRLDLPETRLRALVTHSGGEPLPPGWHQ